MQWAHQEAQRCNHDHVGTQHLLLALLREDQGPATRSLTAQGVSLAAARAAVEQITPIGPDIVMGKLPQTPRLQAALLYAWQEVEGAGRDTVLPEHLLLGLCRAGPGVSARALEALGASPRRACEYVVASLGRDPRRWTWAHPETW
jgi:ATP-dependent Clp protease ATP-binding subunit ClpC